MQFHQIRYFLAVCDHMNFTRAARACNVSQPALTKAIQKLEGELGGSLIMRDKGRFELTPLGRAMRTHLARVEETRRIAAMAARDIAGAEMEQIDLGVMCTVGPNRLGPALSAFQSARPDVELVLHDIWSETAEELLLSGAIDCALLGFTTPLPERLHGHHLFDEPMVLAMGAEDPLLDKDEILAADVHGRAYADRLHCEFRQQFFAELETRALELNVIQRSEREDWLLSLVARGEALTILPRDSATRESIATRPIRDLAVTRGLAIAYSAERKPRKVVLEFAEFLAGLDWENGSAGAPQTEAMAGVD